MKNRQKSRKSSMFTDEERAGLKEIAEDRRRQRSDQADGEADVLAKIAEMPEPDRTTAERFHAIVKASAPDLAPRTFYGMPAYAKDGKVLCFFQNAQKYKARYSTIGFTDKANLDEDDLFPTYYGLKKLTTEAEARIAALVKKAVS